MKLIVSGASGNYGRLAVEELLKRVPAGDLILMSRRPEKLAAFAARGAITRQGDFDDPASLLSTFAGGEKLLMISTGRVGKRLPQHRNCIDAAVRAGVRHIVYTSFVNAGPANPALVAKEHGATEDMLRESGAAWTALRDSQYADAMLEVAAPLAIASGRWLASALEGKIGFVTRRDCVASAVAVLTSAGHENRTYNITGPQLLSFRQVAALACELSGRPIEYTLVDDEGMYRMFDSLGVPREALDDHVSNGVPWSSNDMVSFERAIREGFLEVLSDDVEKLTGHKPQSLRSFFLEHRETLRAVEPRPAA
ncbi:MAG: SDR family oxidoreductase [Steroidobacteraceae bacterium]